MCVHIRWPLGTEMREKWRGSRLGVNNYQVYRLAHSILFLIVIVFCRLFTVRCHLFPLRCRLSVFHADVVAIFWLPCQVPFCSAEVNGFKFNPNWVDATDKRNLRNIGRICTEKADQITSSSRANETRPTLWSGSLMYMGEVGNREQVEKGPTRLWTKHAIWYAIALSSSRFLSIFYSLCSSNNLDQRTNEEKRASVEGWAITANDRFSFGQFRPCVQQVVFLVWCLRALCNLWGKKCGNFGLSSPVWVKTNHEGRSTL